GEAGPVRSCRADRRVRRGIGGYQSVAGTAGGRRGSALGGIELTPARATCRYRVDLWPGTSLSRDRRHPRLPGKYGENTDVSRAQEAPDLISRTDTGTHGPFRRGYLITPPTARARKSSPHSSKRPFANAK